MDATQILEHAKRLFERGADWTTVFGETLGVEGLVFKLPKPERIAFWQSPECQQIHALIAKLRTPIDSSPRDGGERVLTIRLPQELHAQLKAEAHDHRTSMNQLAISKLMQPIPQEFVP